MHACTAAINAGMPCIGMTYMDPGIPSINTSVP
jgi:hypothetical protein